MKICPRAVLVVVGGVAGGVVVAAIVVAAIAVEQHANKHGKSKLQACIHASEHH